MTWIARTRIARLRTAGLRTARTCVALLAVLAAFTPAAAQEGGLAGTWEGAIDPGELDLRIEVAFEAVDGGYRGTLAVPLQGAHGLELRDVERSEGGAVRFVAPELPGGATFEGRLQGDRIAGTFRQGAAEVPFELTRVGRPAAVPAEEDWLGTWRGLLAPGVSDFELVLHLEERDGNLAGTLDIPAQELVGLELRVVSATGAGMTVAVPALPSDARLGLRLEDGELVGTFQQEGVTFPVTFVRAGGAEAGGNAGAGRGAARDRPQTPAGPFPYRSEEVTLEAGDATLAGTLTTPEGAGPFPAILLLNGSGAQDRDATLLGHAPFLVLADRLTREGLAVLRLDDRGVGGSGGSLAAADPDRLAADARAALRMLAGREEVDAARLAVLGHSEGAAVAARAVVDDPADAAEEVPVAAVVLVAAPAVDGLRLLELQNRLVFELQGAREEQIDAQIRYLNRLAEALAAGDGDEAKRLTRERVLAQLSDLPEGQAPVGAARDRLIEAQVAAAASPAFSGYLLADPQRWLRQLNVPTLAVYGRHDVQVPAVQSEGRMRAALRLAGGNDATVVTLPGLNHLMQPAPVGGADEYERIRTTLAPELLDLVSEWLTTRLVD